MRELLDNVAYIVRKKFTLACMCWASGTLLTIFQFDGAQLSDYTVFVTAVAGIFSVTDVLEKAAKRNKGDDG
jgi:TctA family transporter